MYITECKEYLLFFLQITECVSPSEMSHCYSCASDIYGCEAKWFLLFSVTLT